MSAVFRAVAVGGAGLYAIEDDADDVLRSRLFTQRKHSGDALSIVSGNHCEERQREHRKHSKTRSPRQVVGLFASPSDIMACHRIMYEWYRKTADGIFACHTLGQAYGELGVKQSYPSARKWYAKPVDQGFALSQYSCAQMYLNGEGVAKDVREGLLRLAAEQGCAIAQEGLAACYDMGVESSLRSAITWTLKAAKQNDAVAQRNLSFARVHASSSRTT